MFSGIKDYASSMKTAVSETYTSYRGEELDKRLIEATSNDTWQISN